MSKEELLKQIYERYNEGEDEPDFVSVVDDINYLLMLLGYRHGDES